MNKVIAGNKLQQLMVLACAAFGTVPVNATDAEGWYLGAGTFVTALRNETGGEVRSSYSCDLLGCQTDSVKSTYRSEYDNDSHIGFKAGYYSEGDIRLEVEYQKRSHDSAASGNAATLKVRTLMANVWREFELSGLRPYVGVGVGVGQMELNELDDQFLLLQAGGGLSLAITERYVVDVGYRYFMGEPDLVLEGEAGADRREVTRDYQGHSWTLGVRFKLR